MFKKKKIKCHNILYIYNVLNRLIVYVKIEELYRSQYQNKNKDLGRKKRKKILKGSKKLKTGRLCQLKQSPRQSKYSKKLNFWKEHEVVRRIWAVTKEYFKYNHTLSNWTKEKMKQRNSLWSNYLDSIFRNVAKEQHLLSIKPDLQAERGEKLKNQQVNTLSDN